MNLTQHEFHSPTLGNSRTVWIQAPSSSPTAETPDACVFLVAEDYLPKANANAPLLSSVSGKSCGSECLCRHLADALLLASRFRPG